MRRRSHWKFLLAALAIALASCAGASQSPKSGPKKTVSNTPRGPHGGFMSEQTFKDIFFEAVVTKEGIVWVYGYDEQGNQADIIQYYPRNFSVVELRYPPLGTLTTALGPDRDRGALMAKIDIFKARDIGLSPNVIVMVR